MEDFISTRASIKKQSSYVGTSTYEAHKKKVQSVDKAVPKHVIEESPDEDVDPRRKQELEMKRARWDVMKFGISGFEKNKARQAKAALAISLGAKPPKNRRQNYKRLKEERQRLKAKSARSDKFQSGLTSSLVSMKKAGKKTRKKESGLAEVYGKVEKSKRSRK